MDVTDHGQDSDDKEWTLLQISQCRSTPVVTQLVDIGNVDNQQEHSKARLFIQHLQCLRLQGTRLCRKEIDAFHQQQYVALSYTWDPAEHENPKQNYYSVQSWEDGSFQPSEVRNCIFDRILHYMHHKRVELLWIDRHCIRQRACNIPCPHSHCAEHRNGLQAMDLVYQLSEHPVALLGRPLKAATELSLLAQILSGDLVDGNSSFRLSAGTAVRKAKHALSLLHEITQDSWWRRA
jgi:hypothetical protein